MRRYARYRLHLLLRRAAMFVLLPLALLLAFRLLWGLEAAHRLAALRTRFHAQHFAYELSDFPDGAAIPREQNGIYPFIDAINAFTPTTADKDAINLEGHENQLFETQPTPAETAVINTALTTYQPVFDMLDAAAARPHRALPSETRLAFLHDYYAPHWSMMRLLARLCAHGARTARDRHDNVQALQWLARSVTLAHGADLYPTLVGHLVASALHNEAAQNIENCCLSLDLESPAASAAAHRLLADLQNEESFQQGIVEALGTELAFIDIDARHSMPDRFAWWIRPSYDEGFARLSEFHAAQLPAAQAPNWPQARPLICPLPSRKTNLDQIAYSLQDQMSVGWDRPLLIHTRSVTDGRAATLLLAAQLYHAEHHTYPASAAALVPAYLPHIPLDPFANNAPLHYRRDVDGPTAWSVSENGADDAGIVSFDSEGNRLRRFGYGTVMQPDAIYGAAWLRIIPQAPFTAPPPEAPPGL